MSLIEIANGDATAGVNTYGSLAAMDGQRRQANENLKTQHQQSQASGAASAVGFGTSVGLATANPVIGAAAGVGMLLFGSLF